MKDELPYELMAHGVAVDCQGVLMADMKSILNSVFILPPSAFILRT